MNIWVLLVIFALFVTLDKGLTAFNIMQTQRNFPDQVKDDPYKVEKNPLAHWFFVKFGLIGGTAVYWILSILTLFLAFWTLSRFFNEGTALYVCFLIYGFVIINNLYFALRYSKII